MEVFEIWNKRLTKFKKIMFKIKKIHHDYQKVQGMQNANSNYPYITSAAFSTSYVLTFSPISLNGFLFLTTSLPELFVY